MKEKKFDAVLKRSVAMFNMLTGRDLTEREGNAFIQIFDLTTEYHAPGSTGDAAEAFNILSAVQPKPGLRDRPAADELVALDIPTLGDKPKDMPRLPCGCPDGCCTCVIQVSLSDVAKQAGIEPRVLDQIANTESAEHDKPRWGAVIQCDEKQSADLEQLVDAEQAHFAEQRQRVNEASRNVSLSKKSRYVPPPIKSESRLHIPGYDWQIVVLHRLKDPAKTYIMHYAEMPTQAEFAEHFALFHARAHYVHCNEWVNNGWQGITDRYDTSAPEKVLRAPNKVVRTAEAPEMKGRDVSQPPLNHPWEEPDKPYRIRYYSDEVGFIRFTYVDKKPTSTVMAHFHHTKCLAISQAKPKQSVSKSGVAV